MPRKKKLPLGHGLSTSEPEAETEDMEDGPEPEEAVHIEPADAPIVQPPKPKPKAGPKPNRSGVSLEVFLRVSGKRLHQMAGFRRWAINNGLKKREITDWRAEYKKFLQLPV